MSDDTPVTPQGDESGRPQTTRHRRWAWRWTRRGLALLAAGLAGGLVAVFSIDLGPALRHRAEKAASDYLERPMHIGRLSALLSPGLFELDDVVIEGLHQADQPFLSAKKILVNVEWSLISRRIVVEVHMSDWKMAIEKWPNRHSVPKVVHATSGGKKPFTTTSFVYANRGEFTFRDHGTPWSVVAPNLSFNLVRAESLESYVATAHFEKGTVQIQNFLPMSAALTTRFVLTGPHVHLQSIDLVTDGARSHVKGEIDFSKWPEQVYAVESEMDFARMRELFFAAEPWRVSGDGRFKGVFHLYSGGQSLEGQFSSDLAALRTPGRTLLFPSLRGSLIWLPDRFAVTDGSADFYSGRSNFGYALAPLGAAAHTNATFTLDYHDVDLQSFCRGIEWNGIDLRGRASGHQTLTWVNGQLGKTYTGEGAGIVTPPEGVVLAAADLPAPRTEPLMPLTQKAGDVPPLAALPVGGEVKYRLDSRGIELDPSWAASPSTYVGFHGRADFGSQSNVPFHVTSTDWQESDRVLAAILTAAGVPSRPVPVGGRGTFDGAMTESFSRPRVEGTFDGEAVRSWAVTWGRAVGDIVIQDGYVTVRNGVIGDAGDARIHADGQFSLGFRTDNADELKNARVHVDHWPLKDFRRAFNLEDWPVDGIVGLADLELNGRYHGPLGTGTLRIDQGTAWGETFDAANGALTFNGSGLEISRIGMTKGPGRVNGSALIKWDNSYAFDAQGDKIPVETLTSFTVPQAPLSGVLQFTAAGAGEFSAPQYEFKGRVADLFAGDQGVGEVSGVLQVRDKLLTITQLEAASSLLQASASGSIALDEFYDASLTLRFTDTSLDPYLPIIAPKVAPRLSPYTRAKVSGSVLIQGELKNRLALSVFATVGTASLRLFDYDVHNDGDVILKFENDIATITQLKLVGDGTSLELGGDIPRSGGPVKVTANGEANLKILQAFFPSLASSGAATLHATIGDQFTIAGEATITDGRLRHLSFPHGLEMINGPITFDADGITLGRPATGASGEPGEVLRGRMGEGDVVFGGNLTLKDGFLDAFNLTASGQSMRLRVPTGFASTVDANLTLRGPLSSPTLGGDVAVIHSQYLQEIDSEAALLGLAALGPGSEPSGSTGEPSLTLKLDINIHAPGHTLSIDTRLAQIDGSASLTVGGTLDRPSLTGFVAIERGTMFVNGNRYTVRPGQIVFQNPSRIEPYFDVEAETKPRLGGQSYDVTIRITGAMPNVTAAFASDPYLSNYDVFLLLLGERPDPVGTERRAAQSLEFSQQQLMRTAAAQLLTMPISSRVGSVVQRTTPFDTFSVVPLLGTEAALQQGARVTVGKRISDRVFLTYSRALSVAASQSYDFSVALLEYEQSDRISWVLSRNDTGTYALDFRIRHVF